MTPCAPMACPASATGERHDPPPLAVAPQRPLRPLPWCRAMSRESIRALVDAATPGPWHESWRGIGWEVHLDGTPGKCWSSDEPDHTDTHMGQKDTMGDWPQAEADAEFIAASRTAVPLLLAVADAAAAVLEELDIIREHIDRMPLFVHTHTHKRLRDALVALEALL